MKKIVFLSLMVLTFLSLTSCKKTEESKPETIETKKDCKQNFNVQIQASSSKKDDFALYFTEDNTINFTGENAVWCGIKGGNIEETVNFELTEDRVPTHIRLDFGLKSDQDSVVVKNIKVNYFENNFSFSGSEFFRYFNDDKQFITKVNQAKGTITFYPKGKIYKTPYFYPTQITIDNIKKIVTEKK
jgi:hypothetical protein